MDSLIENTIAFILIAIVFYFSIQTVIIRIRVERELIDIIASKLTIEKYKCLENSELKKFILDESKELMDIKDYTLATYPFIQDSLYAQSAYIKRFRTYLEHALNGN